MEYLTKKNLTILNIVLGVIGLVGFLQLITLKGSSFTDLSGISSKLTLLNLMFVVSILLELVALAAAAMMYFHQKDKDKNLIVTMVVAGIMLLLLLLSNSAVSIIREAKNVLNGNLSGAMSLYMQWGGLGAADITSKIESGLKILSFAYVVSTAYGACNVYFYKTKKNGFIKADGSLDIDVQKTQETAESVKQNVSEVTSKVKAFYQTPNGKKTITIVGAVVVFLGAYLIYLNVFKKTEINLINGCKINVTGNSGSGYATVRDCDVMYNHENQQLSNFINNVRYEFKGNGKFKNGDKVVAKAVYNEELAKSLKLKITNTTISTKVSGLKESFKKETDIPKKIKVAVEKQMKEKVKSYTDEIEFGNHSLGFDNDQDIKVTKNELVGKLVHTGGSSSNPRINYVNVYRFTVTGKVQTSYFNETFEDQTKNVYIAFKTSDITSDYLKELPELSDGNPYKFKIDEDKFADMELRKLANRLMYFSGKLTVIK